MISPGSSLPPRPAGFSQSPLPPERIALADALSTIGGQLSALYRGASLLIQEPAFPGRLRLIAHCVREIGNRLPDAHGAPVPPRWDPDGGLKAISEAWANAGLPTDTEFATESASHVSAQDARLPASVLGTVQVAVAGYRAHASHRDRVEALFAARDPGVAAPEARGPLVAEWMSVSRWFQRHAHEPYPFQEPPPDSELLTQFERFEGVLRGLIQPFYDTASALDEILARANT